MNAKRKNTSGGPQRPRVTVIGSDVKIGDVVFRGTHRVERLLGGNDVDPKYATYAPGRVFECTRLVAGVETPVGATEKIHISDDGTYEVR